ncbi:hypothetical protein AAFF_G00150650 [Aldrovandia affinis]|uniref:Uncharacterized protein n=1 Tax=Aldrovandia affinis TaxID=143900 RepID=A0AAD7W9F4_9TELE|nr:hypothetical protein AAFF_G00150650 [Aldrovandia affinis]
MPGPVCVDISARCPWHTEGDGGAQAWEEEDDEEEEEEEEECVPAVNSVAGERSCRSPRALSALRSPAPPPGPLRCRGLEEPGQGAGQGTTVWAGGGELLPPPATHASAGRQREKSIRRREAARGRPAQPLGPEPRDPPGAQPSPGSVPASAQRASLSLRACGSAQGALRPGIASDESLPENE